MALRRVVLDTNVCFPISLLDVMLRLDEAAFHEVIWTEDLLGELAEVWVEKGARPAESAARICDDVRKAFADQEVLRAEYDHLVDSMPGNDPEDHPHAAAAAARAPATIVTANTADFPSKPLGELGVTVLRPTTTCAGCSKRTPTACSGRRGDGRRSPESADDDGRCAGRRGACWRRRAVRCCRSDAPLALSPAVTAAAAKSANRSVQPAVEAGLWKAGTVRCCPWRS